MSVYEEKPVQESLDGFWSGIIASDASSLTDEVEVLIKAFSLQHRFGPCKWALNGSKMPERGNECIVVFDEKQRPVIMQWYPTTPEIDTTIEVPIGGIVPYGGDSDPSGGKWFVADGRELNRVGTYADLFAVVGTNYGVGNGSTTFNIPNCKGKVPVGLDSGQTEFDVRGETGGAKVHTLLTAEMPAHVHTWNESGFGLSFANENNPGGASGHYVRSTLNNAEPVSSTGGGGSHNNLQPYVVTNYIIRVL